jgi:formate/nitrite transporter FocA (FNT family)
MCVCAAVFLAYAAEDVGGKIVAMWLPIMAFAAIGWEHSVANMVMVSMGIFVGADVKY